MNRHGADEGTSTGHGRCVGRLAGLAVALGIGAALAAAPWVASAAPSSASANAPGQNHAVSTQGVVREQRGTATASSIDAPGSVAIATGANSKAISTCRNCRAEVNGAGSAALASGKSDNSVIVKGDKSFGIVDAGDSTGNSSDRCAAMAASTADLGDENAAHTPSPVCLNKQPPCASTAPRSTASCAASAIRMPSASASHRRVEPSTSVNRNVTTPEGVAAGLADTHAESHNGHFLPRTSPEYRFRDGISDEPRGGPMPTGPLIARASSMA